MEDWLKSLVKYRQPNINYVRTYRMDSFVYGNVFFFPLIDRLVCTIQSNQTLDALIKYVA